MPLTLELRYFASLTPVGGVNRARYYAVIQASYQGIIREHVLNLEIDVFDVWTYATVSLSDVRGIIIGYDLYIEVEGYRGKIMLDNVRAIHGGTNWARDPRFDNMNRRFEKQYALVQRYWEPLDVPTGASYKSVFEPIVET